MGCGSSSAVEPADSAGKVDSSDYQTNVTPEQQNAAAAPEPITEVKVESGGGADIAIANRPIGKGQKDRGPWLPFIRFDKSAVTKDLSHNDEIYLQCFYNSTTVVTSDAGATVKVDTAGEMAPNLLLIIEREQGFGPLKDGDTLMLKNKETGEYLECVSDDCPLKMSPKMDLDTGLERQRFIINKQGRPTQVGHRDIVFLQSWIMNLVEVASDGDLISKRWQRGTAAHFTILRKAVVESTTTELARRMQFQSFDLDGNGGISRGEMRYMQMQVKGVVNDDDLDALMGQLDPAGTGNIPFNAFAKWADDGGMPEDYLQHAEVLGNIAQRCHDALQEERALIEVLTTNDMRGCGALMAKFKDVYGFNLSDGIAKQTKKDDSIFFSNYWKRTMFALLEDEVDLWTRSLYDAMNGLGTDEDSLTTLVCTMPERLRDKIHDRYLDKYGKSLLDHIDSETSFNYKKVLLAQARSAAESRAHALYYAMHGGTGIGTTESQLIRVICGLDLGERAEVIDAFARLYSKNLIDSVDSETSGDFKKALHTMLAAQHTEFDLEADCIAMKEAMDGWGTDENKLVEMICGKTQRQMEDVNAKFPEIDEGRRLFIRVRDETSGHFQATMLGCIRHPMRQLAYSVRECMEGWGTDDTGLITLLVHLPDYKKEALIKMYKEIHERDLLEDIASETSGDYKKALLALVKPAPRVWAEAMKGAMKGLGTNDELLINFMVIAKENASEVREEFAAINNGEDLASWIEGDCSGDYAKTLIAIGDRNSEDKVDMLPIYWAQRAKDACEDIQTLKEVLTSMPAVCIKRGTEIYKAVYGRSLKEDIEKKCDANKKGFWSMFSDNWKNSMTKLLELPIDLRVMALNEAMACWGTDEGTLTRIICTTPENMYEDVAKLYVERYGKTLLDHIRSETSFNYKKALELQTMSKIDSRCWALNKAMKGGTGIGTDEMQLVRVCLFSTMKERRLIRVRYETMFGKELIEHLSDETSGSFQAALIAIFDGPMDWNNEFTVGPEFDFDADCDQLKEAMDGMGTDEETLIKIITRKLPHQIQELKDKYEHKFGESLFARVNDETFGPESIFCSDAFRQTMLGLLRDPKRQLAYSVRDCMKGFGTDDTGLITCLVHLTEMERKELVATFAEIDGGGDIFEWIKGDTSGDYKECLLALVKPHCQVYVDALTGAMKGLGTSDNLLINWMCICKDRMDEVREHFKAQHGKELAEWIASECSSDYKETLVMLANRECLKFAGVETALTIPQPPSKESAIAKFNKVFNLQCKKKREKPDVELIPSEEAMQEMGCVFLYFASKSSCAPNLDKPGLYDLTNCVGFPCADDGPDLYATFMQWNVDGTGEITWNDFVREMMTRVNDEAYYTADPSPVDESLL